MSDNDKQLVEEPRKEIPISTSYILYLFYFSLVIKKKKEINNIYRDITKRTPDNDKTVEINCH
jgi:hypothetical protein